MGISKITRNFQVTVPEDVREIKDLKEGDELIFMVENGDIKLLKKEENTIEKAAGIWDIEKDGKEFERDIRSEWESRE